MRKLNFSEGQKRAYRKLKIVSAIFAIIGLSTSVLLYVFGYTQLSSLIVSVLLFLLSLYVYAGYRKILSMDKSTKPYATFQRTMFRKTFRLLSLFLAPYTMLVIYLITFHTRILAQQPILLLLLILVPAIILGIWAMLYENEEFGTLVRAP